MVHRISNIVARLAENEEAVSKLLQENGEFQALCDEYARIGQELENVNRLDRPGAAAEADTLRNRRSAIDEAIVTRIEGYNPI